MQRNPARRGQRFRLFTLLTDDNVDRAQAAPVRADKVMVASERRVVPHLDADLRCELERRQPRRQPQRLVPQRVLRPPVNRGLLLTGDALGLHASDAHDDIGVEQTIHVLGGQPTGLNVEATGDVIEWPSVVSGRWVAGGVS